MDARIAKLHNKVFSTPQFSKEREKAISALSDADRTAIFNLERDYMAGRTTRQDIIEMARGGNKMTYAQFRTKMNDDYKGQIQELSKFAKESPELYKQYRARWKEEQDEKQRLHNRRLNENTFKNKPYSYR